MVTTCPRCAGPLEADMDFCPTCGLPRTAGGAAMAVPIAPPGHLAPPAVMPPPPPHLKPPRNPRQTWSVTAGVLFIISAMLCLLLGVIEIYWMSFDTEYDRDKDIEETVVYWDELLVGAMYVVGFAFGQVGTFACFRLRFFKLALAAGGVLLVAYVTGALLWIDLLILGIPILVLSIVGLVLAVFARGVFGWDAPGGMGATGGGAG